MIRFTLSTSDMLSWFLGRFLTSLVFAGRICFPDVELLLPVFHLSPTPSCLFGRPFLVPALFCFITRFDWPGPVVKLVIDELILKLWNCWDHRIIVMIGSFCLISESRCYDDWWYLKVSAIWVKSFVEIIVQNAETKDVLHSNYLGIPCWSIHMKDLGFFCFPLSELIAHCKFIASIKELSKYFSNFHTRASQASNVIKIDNRYRTKLIRLSKA